MSIAISCIEDLETRVKTLTEFKGTKKIFSVYSENDLLDKSKLLKLPAVGIMYEGITGNSGDPTRQGIMADIGCSVLLILDGKSIGNINTQNKSAQYLDEIRDCILTANSPTKHKWRFVSEIPAGVVGNVMVYVQRWATALPLTGR